MDNCVDKYYKGVRCSHEDVLEFLEKRFKEDCSWTSGNCFYMALILKYRFPGGRIQYEPVDGHFVFFLNGRQYDYTGVVSYPDALDWEELETLDNTWAKRIVRDCMM